MVVGYHHFWKHPYIYMFTVIYLDILTSGTPICARVEKKTHHSDSMFLGDKLINQIVGVPIYPLFLDPIGGMSLSPM